ncbi:CotH kinase family protein [Empedobacter falsenii]
MFTELLTWIFLNILSDNPKNVTAEKIRTAFSKLMENVESVVTSAGTGLYKGNIEPTSNVPGDPNANIFLIATPGTYISFKKQDGSAIVLAENSFGFIFRTNNGFVLNSVIIPQPNMTAVNEAIQRMDDFIRDFTVTTVSEITENTTNPINSDAVLNFVDNDFWNREIKKNVKEVERTATNGYYNNQGLLIKDTNGVPFLVELNNGDYNKIKVSGVGLYAVGNTTLSSIFTLNSSGIKTELKPYTATPEVMNGVEFEIPNDAVKLFYNAVRKGATTQVTIEPQLFLLSNDYLVRNSKAKQIDEILGPLYDLKTLQETSVISDNTPSLLGFYNQNKIFTSENSVVRGFIYEIPSNAELVKLKGYGFFSGGEGTLYGVKNDNSIVELEPRFKVNTLIDKNFELTGFKEIFGTMMLVNGVVPKVTFLSLDVSEKETANDKKLEQYIKQIAGENSGVKIGNSLIVGKPNTAIEIDFVTNEILPTAKPTIINGEVSIKIDDVLIKKYATLGVQGTSTAIYPKKNWSLALFNNEAKSSAFEMSIDGLPFHDEFVFKADWVDATNMRNLLCNRLWEQIIQSRKGFPKREFNEYIYNASDATFENRFPTRALGHVQGFPCIFKVNGEFYGVGCFNIGKKRQNYNLKKSNKKHIQLEDGSDGQRNLITWKANDWNVRNPSMTGYVEEGEIPDAIVKASVDRLFAYHGSGQTNMIANFEQYYTKKNIFDKIIFSQAIYDLDGVAKNYMLTTWDGLIWHHLPYDMDSVFGLNFNGLNYLPTTKDVFTHYESVGGEEQAAFLSGRNFYRAILTGYKSEINARYKELRDNDILSVDNLYKLAMEIHLKWGDENFKKEFEKWTDRPSNTIIKTSISQILKYMEDRFVWLDTYFNYIP